MVTKTFTQKLFIYTYSTVTEISEVTLVKRITEVAVGEQLLGPEIEKKNVKSVNHFKISKVQLSIE